jgi:F0F1-type ATP synthase epsilon subunit
VVVKNRESTLADREAFAVTSHNDVGPFDVLPRHANFISIINKEVVIRAVDGTEQKIEINKGIMNVQDNTVSVYLDIASV